MKAHPYTCEERLASRIFDVEPELLTRSQKAVATALHFGLYRPPPSADESRVAHLERIARDAVLTCGDLLNGMPEDLDEPERFAEACRYLHIPLSTWPALQAHVREVAR